MAKLLIAVCLLLSVNLSVKADKISVEDRNFFEKKIRPILVKHCYECHSKDSKELGGKLLLDSHQAMVDGGESGPALIAGNPEESLLIQALKYQDTEMPPDNPLPESVINDFVKWIQTGAPDPRTAKAAKAETPELDDPGLWSFHRRSEPQLPKVQTNNWTLDYLDYFILSKIEQAKLVPTQDADARTLIRRLYVDLLGLPPTFDQVMKFEIEYKEQGRTAYENLVNHLLNQPQFGERWGRHWLDIARYGESNGDDGLGRNASFPYAWRYRDYVIDALNKDLPYNQFLTEQIAGDLLPYKTAKERNRFLTATGFLAIGSKPAAAMNKNFAMDIVDDQVNVVSTALMGLSVSCARCHDHKHDPIPTRDYYAVAGIFTNTETLYGKAGEEKLTAPPTPLHALISDLNKTNSTKIKNLKLPNDHSVKIQSLRPFHLSDFTEPDKTFKKTEKVKFSQETYASVKDSKAIGAFDSPAKSYSVSFWFKNSLAINSRPITAYLFSRAKIGDKQLSGDHLGIGGTHDKERTGKLFIFNGNGKKESIAGSTVLAKDTWNHIVLIRDNNQIKLFLNGNKDPEIVGKLNSTFNDSLEFSLATRSDHFAPLTGNMAGFSIYNRAITPAEAKQIHSASKQPVITSAKPLGWAMGVRDKAKFANTKIHINGDGSKKGPEVPRGFLTAYEQLKVEKDAPRFTTSISIDSKKSGRLELANWITHPDHPQTARVLVNRVWLHLFGQAIVNTPDDFGIYGSRPTHPELLDHLANRFIKEGWSLKRLIKSIVLSRTYQLDSRCSQELYERDPNNLVYARHLRRRLDAESIRDAILCASNNLELTPPAGSAINNIDKLINWPPGESTNIHTDNSHRSIYLCMLRHAPPPSLAQFDLPSGVEVTGQRNNTTLPSQSLFLLNSPLVITEAEKLAANILKNPDSTQDQRITQLYQQTLSRNPTSIEMNRAIDYLSLLNKELTHSKDQELLTWSSFCQSLIASNEFRYVD